MTSPISSLKSRESAGGADDSAPIALQKRAMTHPGDAPGRGRDIHQDFAGWLWSTRPLDATNDLATGKTIVSGQPEQAANFADAGEDQSLSDAQTCTDIMFRNMWWNMLVDQPMKDRAEQEDDLYY